MKLIFFLHSFGIGGAERRCATVANYLAQQGHDVVAVLLDSPEILYEIDEKIQIFYLPNDKEKIPLTFKKDFTCKFDNTNKERLRVSKEKITQDMFDDVIKTYSDRIHDFIIEYPGYMIASMVSLYSVACAIALQDLPNKFVFIECNAPDKEFDKEHYFNILKRRFYPRADAAVFQTESERDFYDFLDTTEKYVIPNPVRELGVDRYEGNRKKIVVNYCRIRKAKRLPLLVDAFAIFHKNFPEYRLQIFGDGPEKQGLMDYIKNKDLNEFVSICDLDINVHEKVRDYAMFVSSSLFEGMSNSMLEAMAIGLPVVCTDCYGGGARAVINDGENGLLVPVEDVAALSNAMKRIANDIELSDRLSRNATKIKQTLSEIKICQKWCETFNEIYNC